MFKLSKIKLNELTGLYELIDKSDTSKASDFKDWLKKVLLPSLEPTFEQFSRWCLENKSYLEESRREEESSSNSFVYVVTHSQLKEYNVYKIGSTRSLDRLLVSLNGCSPFDFEITYACCVNDDESLSRKLEESLQEKFKGKRARRNFYVLEREDLDEIPIYCKEFILEREM